ncbi:heavy metal translocating P-type ATPase [Lachnospira pectinoschiza]|uniref:Cd(2+)-exporting ATPase n=1 Tax=Lachnospira pectinoschiza TaxID=28052 RepID=A0A1G9WPA0_9FIRM|nr:heavy metal translocating P-type ATPase [Lachnospira pectinoschiza]SDM85996.1 Cd2+/Zn2+-exporting ATPase [Lachnospira pectinoschiza]
MTKKQKKMRARIIVSGILYACLFIADKLGALEDFPILAVAIAFLVPYLIIGYDVILRAFKNISKGHIFDENFLMMIATFAAFATGEFTESVAVMLFYQVGELFQSYAVGKSRASIAEMMSIAPDFANLEDEEGNISEVDPEDVEVGSVLLVRPGEKIPIDGVVIEGESFVDTAALTGESVPRKVSPGADVISGCVNGDTALKIRTTKAYEDSTVSKILELVENASSKKSRMENFITRFAKYYTPVVTIGAVLLALIPPTILGIMSGNFAYVSWIHRACIFLIVSCPCAMVISVPLGFFGGIGAASKIGVLVKGSNYLEAIAQMKSLVFDKTGTLTKGEFKVSEVINLNGFSKEDILYYAAFAEKFSTHPIAKSILIAYGKEVDLSLISNQQEVSGQGISCLVNKREVLIGNYKLMQTNGIDCEINDSPATICYLAVDGKFAGYIIISDVIKEGSKEAMKALSKVGVSKLVMLTGDRKEVAMAVSKELSLTDCRYELLPTDKVSNVEELIKACKKDEKLGFVGDGINDAPVLMRADVGIAMGSLGSDAAIEAADVVIMDDDLRKIPKLVRIARKTLRIVKQNVVFALGVKIIVLILGAFGLATMWEAVFADVGVAVIAILNSMRVLSSNYDEKN